MDGVTVQEVADTLHISVNTVRMHIENMHASTQTRTLHGLAIWAMRHGECCEVSA
ncbi:MAG TPA: LuxR C-terminal-related transcriptional regulator [Dehalococcoidia bacterium]|nr:LuxR C-terminal-related transcriptional regulator [Dehalococcoidia bacterium]